MKNGKGKEYTVFHSVEDWGFCEIYLSKEWGPRKK